MRLRLYISCLFFLFSSLAYRQTRAHLVSDILIFSQFNLWQLSNSCMELIHTCVSSRATPHSALSVRWTVTFQFFSRGHATLHLAVSVGRSVGRSVRHIFEFRSFFALLHLPNCPRLDSRVSGLVLQKSLKFQGAKAYA